MAIKQTVWSLDDKKELLRSSLINENELEDLLYDNISLLRDDWLVIGRQVRTLYGGEIDLLCIDIAGNPVVIELKRNKTPREITAQALDYASWVENINAEDLAKIYLKHTIGTKSLGDAFLERFGVELSNDNDDADTQIVIVATDMDGSTERIIKYLQSYGIAINVLFFNVFEHQGKRLLSRAWMSEPEHDDKPPASRSMNNWNGEYYFSYGGGNRSQSWDAAVKYGFLSGGGGSWYSGTMRKLELGSRVWVNIPGVGYTGVGIVTEESRPARESSFLLDGIETNFFDLPLLGNYDKAPSPENEEYLVKINWIKTVQKNDAVKEFGFFGNQNTVARPKVEKWDFTVKRLKALWGIEN